MTVQQRCKLLLWSITDLAHEARISWKTAKNAWDEHEPSQRTKRDIAKAFTGAFHQRVEITDIRWTKE